MSVATRYIRLRQHVDEVCAAASRRPEDVLLLAVSKTVDVDAVAEAMEAGATAFGENRPDEIVRKHAAFPDASWHFIGNVQSRRIADIVSAADLIHSVYKPEHLPKIDRAASSCGKIQKILIEVNVSGEESKSGADPVDVYDLICSADDLPNVEVCGLMTMAPRAQEEAIVETFDGLSHLRDDLQERCQHDNRSVSLHEISMGMSEDWTYAIERDATIVRIGRAIFSDDFE